MINPIAWLNPGRWLAIIAAALALAGGIKWWEHAAEQRGQQQAQTQAQAQSATERAEQAQQLIAAHERARNAERALSHATQEIDRAHQDHKARLDAAARAADDRLRQFQAAATAAAHAASPTPHDPDPATPSRTADPSLTIARECAAALTAMGAHADRLAARLGALQDYTHRVCVTPANASRAGVPSPPH
jgi:hypothetical protein